MTLKPDITLLDFTEDLKDLGFKWFNDPVAFGQYDQPQIINRQEFESNWNKGQYKTIKFIHDGFEIIGWVRYFISDRKPWICAFGVFICLPEKRGKGFGASALTTLMKNIKKDYAGVCKFEVMTDIKNKPAQALFEKLGFIREGVFQRYWKLHGEFSDMCTYAILF